jgi:hypothetical protein
MKLDQLNEAARLAGENYDRELAEEKNLADEFARCQLTTSPAQFGALKDALDQKQLIVAAAFRAKNSAIAQLDAAQGLEALKLQVENNRRYLDAKRAELNAATAALVAKQDACLRLQREIPTETAKVQVLMAEVAQLQQSGRPAQSQPAVVL